LGCFAENEGCRKESHKRCREKVLITDQDRHGTVGAVALINGNLGGSDFNRRQ
jgi:hypothetical protein